MNASPAEAEGPWQQSVAYKVLPPHVKSPNEVDLSQIPTIQEQPVNSAITAPAPGHIIDPNEEDTIDVAGYAFSGGGRNICQVDVSSDGGETWTVATLSQGSQQPTLRAWAWTHWAASLPVPSSASTMTVCCRAHDISGEVQPASLLPVWNLRGLNCNAHHCRTFPIRSAKA